MPHKIAIVEDDLPIQQMYKLKLSSLGYDVQTADNGRLGLELCEEFMPDIILLDIRMPEMSGDEMLKRLRETEWGAGMRVIILTNISKSEAPHSLRLLGVDRYITKAHHTPSQITEIIKEVLN